MLRHIVFILDDKRSNKIYQRTQNHFQPNFKYKVQNKCGRQPLVQKIIVSFIHRVRSSSVPPRKDLFRHIMARTS